MVDKKWTRLREILLKKGLPQVEICRRTKLDPAIMSRITNGKLIPTPIEQGKISMALEMPVSEIWPEQEKGDQE